MLRKRIKKNTLKWKKIYAEQLLDMMDEEENALQKIYLTGYVLELKKNRYFAGWYKERIVCRSLEYARYFPSAEAAEEYVHKYLGFAGMTCYICERLCPSGAIFVHPFREELPPVFPDIPKALGGGL